jgi:hypothetical protein
MEKMTCIVGAVDDKGVYIGGDSAAVTGHSIYNRSDTKVFKKDDFIFGFTGSYRMGQLIRYKLSIPKIKEDQDIDEYLHCEFIDSLIECMKSNNFANDPDGQISGGTFIFGFRGKLYTVYDDFQIAQNIENYSACGCGCEIALGCMFALSQGNPNVSVHLKIEMSLKAAARHSSDVVQPFHIVELLHNKSLAIDS